MIGSGVEGSGTEDEFTTRDRRERRRKALMVKQFNANLTTAGYALLAGGGWEPFLNGKAFGLNHAMALSVGLALLASAVYLAPEGETDHVGP